MKQRGWWTAGWSLNSAKGIQGLTGWLVKPQDEGTSAKPFPGCFPSPARDPRFPVTPSCWLQFLFAADSTPLTYVREQTDYSLGLRAAHLPAVWIKPLNQVTDLCLNTVGGGLAVAPSPVVFSISSCSSSSYVTFSWLFWLNKMHSWLWAADKHQSVHVLNLIHVIAHFKETFFCFESFWSENYLS